MPPSGRLIGTAQGRREDAVQDDGMDDRLTVAAAAERLGITKEAVRKRIHRGTLRSDRAPDGTVMVYVPPSSTPSGTPSGEVPADRDLLYEEMRERIAYLERQVEEEREARRRADTLLARLMDRVPELEAPTRTPAPPESREEAAQEPAGEPTRAAAPAPSAADPQSGAEERSSTEGPSGAIRSPETAVGGPGNAWDTSHREEPLAEEESPRQREPSWWRRFFGFD